jgi:hypothetical protein
MCVAAAIAGSVGGALISGNAAKKAAKSQGKAADAATAAQERMSQKSLDLQEKMFNKQIELQAPFRENGLSANNRIAALLGLPSTSLNAGDDRIGSLMKPFSQSDFQTDPGYQFRMGEGQKAVENSAASRGGALSGAALKAITKYGQDFASNEYTNAYNRYNNNQTNQFNRLSSLAGGGQQASNQLGNAAGNYANAGASIYGNLGNAQSQNIIGAGNAQAAGQVGQANAWNNAIGGATNAYQQNEMMKRILGTGSGGGGMGSGSFFGGSFDPSTSFGPASYSGTFG